MIINSFYLTSLENIKNNVDIYIVLTSFLAIFFTAKLPHLGHFFNNYLGHDFYTQNINMVSWTGICTSNLPNIYFLTGTDKSLNGVLYKGPVQFNSNSKAIKVKFPNSVITTTYGPEYNDSDLCGNDLVTLVGHGLPNGKRVSFNSITTTTGIAIYNLYYVVNATTDTFQLSLTQGGTPIALTNNGTGTIIYQTLVIAIEPNVSVTVDVPASISGTSNLAYRNLNTQIAVMKRWAVSG